MVFEASLPRVAPIYKCNPFLRGSQVVGGVVPFYFWTDGVRLRRFHYALIQAEKHDNVKPKNKLGFVN